MAKTAVSPAPEGAKPKTAPGVKPVKPKPEPNLQLVALFTEYSEHVEKAELMFIKFAKFVNENQLDRATVVVSIQKARGCTYETADQQYSRMKKLLNDEETLKALEAGEITLRVARERTKTAQKNPKSSKPEAKEARYNNTLKSFVDAAKESGYTLREILLGVEAELRAAQIK
jgi:hypothetical protein